MIRLISFGYSKREAPRADVVVDCRTLPNPHDVPELRGRSGLDPDVQNHVLSGVKYISLGLPVLTGARDGQTIAFGCTGGTGRSVVMAEVMAFGLRNKSFSVEVEHMELGHDH